MNKIFFVENIDPYNPRCGGIGTYLRNLTLFLKNRKVRTVLIGAGDPGNDRPLEIKTDEFIPVTARKRSHPYYILCLLFKARKLALEPGTVLHGQRPDVLFPFVFYRRFRKNHKLVCSLHSIQSRTIRDKRGKLWAAFYRFLERKTIKHADAVIAVGKEVQEYLNSQYPGCERKIFMLPAGADDRQFYPLEDPGERSVIRQTYGLQDDERVMIFAGRLEKEKNLPLLIDAFTLVKKKIPAAKLLLVGTGRQEEYIKSYVREKGVTGVIFHGPATRDQMPLLMNCADVFTLASFYESGPIVVREALACNLAVVSSDVGDASLLLENLPGCYISGRNPGEFSRKVILSLSYDGPRNYRQAISEYGNDSIFEKTLSLYESGALPEKG